MSDEQPPDYVVGEPHPNTQGYATFEYKRPSPDHTGGGYARWRSIESRPETPRQGSEDVFVPIHRLAAVAWHLPDGVLGEDVNLSQLDGMDVHHVTPDGGAGMPSANGEDWTEVLGHGDHSAVTQSQRRAWAEDEKRKRERQERFGDTDRCAEPRCEEEVAARVGGEDYCLTHATENSDGETIEVL